MERVLEDRGGSNRLASIYLLASVVAAGLSGFAVPACSIPLGYTVDSTGIATVLPEPWEAASGEFTASVRRYAPDSLSARLLTIAESTYPPRGLLLAIAFDKGYELGADTSSAPLWWCRGIGASRVPYAVTSRAVLYYAKLTSLYRERDFREAGTRPLFQSELVYRGTIAQRDTFISGSTPYSDVYVAQLKLLWTWDDGVFTALTDASRVVILSRAGEVLAVDGDGQAEEKVSISGTRQIGRSKEILR